MRNKTEKINTEKSLLERITSNEITAHSKNYFRAKLALLIILIGAVFLVSIFLFSFIMFDLRASGQISLIGFAGHGINLFLKLFPWTLFTLDLILIISASFIARSFRFGYRTPAVYLLLIVLGTIALGGIVVDRGTPLHTILLQSANNHTLPVFEHMYKKVRQPPSSKDGIYRGVVSAIQDDSITVNVESETDETVSEYKVIIKDAEIIDDIKLGDNIFIAGVIINGDIHAKVIEIAPHIPGILYLNSI